MNNPNHIFIGTYGNCACIDQQTGKELWRTYLPGVVHNPVTLYYEDKRIYCGSYGKFFILCSLTGKILAQNEMVGQGYGFLTFTTKKSESQSKPQIIQPQIQQPQFIPQIQQPQLIQQPIFFPQMIQPQMIQQQMIQPQIQQIQQPQMIQPPLYNPQQNLIVNQQIPFVNPHQFLYPQPQINIQPNLQPQFPPNNDFLMDEQETMKKIEQMEKDEELAKSLDREINGNNNQIPLNQHLNNLYHQNVQLNQRILPINNNNLNSVDDMIFVGLNSYVTAINKYNATEIWKTNISGSLGIAPSIIYSKDKLLIGTSGNVLCLDALTGKELWRNNLPGLRYGSISIVTPSNPNNFVHSNTPLFIANQY